MNWLEQLIVMWMVGIIWNPMNLLAFRWSDLYLSKTQIYVGFFMASMMTLVHSCLHYGFGHLSLNDWTILFSMGTVGAVLGVYVLRN
jgi:fatty acid desaturase